MKTLSFFAVLFAAMTMSADVTCSWTAAGSPETLGDGAVRFTYDGSGNVSSMTVTPADGGTVYLDGDAISLAADAEIKFAAPGRFVVGNALNGSGMLSVTNSMADRIIEYDGARLDTEEWTLMFPDKDLADYCPLKSVRGSGSGEYDTGVYSPYGTKRFEADGYRQMSVTLIKPNATKTESKIVMLRLRQNGAGIEGKVDGACYHSTRFIHGEDIAKLIECNAVSPDANFTTNSPVHTAKSSGGYGVDNFFMQMENSARIELNGAVSSGMRYAVHGVELKVRAASVGGGLSGSVAGSGVLTLSGNHPAEGSDPCVDDYDGFIARSTVTVAENRRLVSLTNVTADITGAYVSGIYYSAKMYHIRGNNLCITGEVQVASDSSTWRFVTVELRQSGFGVKATAIDSGWIKNGTMNIESYVGVRSVYESDFDAWRTAGQEPSWTATVKPVGACNFRFFYSEPVSAKIELDTAFVNMMKPTAPSSGTLNSETILRIGGDTTSQVMAVVPNGSANAFPTNGIVEVLPGGDLVMSGGIVSGNSALVRVLPGGRLRVRRASALDSAQHVHVEGGELIMRDDSAETIDNSWCFLERVFLRDGAQVKGAPYQIGYSGSSALWWVSGTEPSVCEASALFYRQSATVEFKVLDVTDDDDPDFLYKGDFNAQNEAGSSVVFRKTGDGTLSHSGSFGNLMPLSAPVSVEGGTWLMDGSASSGQAYCMDGGDLAAAAGTENAAGALKVSKDGVLKVGADGKLTFADSSSIAWADGVRVTVDADLAAGAVRFGTSDAGLTKSQLSKMRYCSRRVYLDAQGYLRDAGVFGTVISFR